MCNCGGIYFTVIPLTLLPITATPGGAAAAIISMEYIRVYLAIAIFIYIDIAVAISWLLLRVYNNKIIIPTFLLLYI